MIQIIKCCILLCCTVGDISWLDAFSGILGASLASGEELNKSIDTAIVGSALSVTKYGAQESMPLYDEIIQQCPCPVYHNLD